MRATRRSFLRAVGTAVVVASSSGGVAGESCHPSKVTSHPSDGDYPPMEGFVFYPESYRECLPFRIVLVSRRFRTRVGRRSTACHRPRREYVAYGISYESGRDAGEYGSDGPAEPVSVVDLEGVSTFLAVRTSDEEELALPHEYFVPRQRYEFVSSHGLYVFHGRCSDSPTPLRGVTFAPIF